MGWGVSAEESSALRPLNKAVSFSRTCHKGRFQKISLYNVGGQKATTVFLKYLLVILWILNKGTRFSSSLAVGWKPQPFFFFFESFTKSICDAFICSVLIRSGQFFSLSSQVAFKGMNERELWQKFLCFGSMHRSRAVFRFSLLELSRHR